ncbi:sugar ABC transporter substrate-binding protein [Pseudonocardia sp. H11422]|uniref:sugar ABC transporter substrate-binding protein n=1 Tax=Pseudonocardia sp. H11422 TaxID=2835866 RepID=UPI0020277DB7|nr:sugar ABC transporter substrate-binding protein [Pseudonocardia sp. H11422]
MFRIGKRSISTAAALACVALVAAGCSSQGGAQATGGGGSDTAPLKFAMVTHAPAGDTFFDIIRKGADAAAAESNVEYTYTNDGDPTRQAVLIENAVNSRPDALLVSVPAVAALTPAIQKAVAAGIPVIGFNAGRETYQDWGAVMYFGQDEAIAGNAAGERLRSEGAGKVLCVIQAQGQSQLEARCDGVEQGFAGEVENINVNGTDLTSVRSTLESKLRQDPSITHVLTLGAPFALTAVQSVQDSGSPAKVVTFDTNPELVGAIQAGDVLWAVDQQPYLQGYLAVDFAALYKRNGNVLGGGSEVLTGPAFIDQSNIAQVAEFAQAGTR